MLRLSLIIVLLLTVTELAAGPLFEDDFESGLQHWIPLSEQHARIITESGDNQVLELTPRPKSFSHVILAMKTPEEAVRMEGRFLFPTDGDGYLGFIYNHKQGEARTDFGVLYVKSNGSYVRVSPHYDGNPSWRLYESLKVDLEGDQHIVPGQWYDFRLDVQGRSAALYIGNLEEPVVVYDEAPHGSGALGLEARPGFGDPVWVDDVRVSRLDPVSRPGAPAGPVNRLNGWQYQAAVEDPLDTVLASPELDPEQWHELATDLRGAVITGLHTQYDSGDRSVLYVRASFEQAGDQPSAWLAISSANRIDVWMDGYYRGTVAPERFIWSDHVQSVEHNGARLPLLMKPGRHELVFRVHGRRFAGGGFFADVIYPGE